MGMRDAWVDVVCCGASKLELPICYTSLGHLTRAEGGTDGYNYTGRSVMVDDMNKVWLSR